MKQAAQQQLATATKELHKFCNPDNSTTMAEASLSHIHIEDASEALEDGRFEDVQRCLNLFWKVIRGAEA